MKEWDGDAARSKPIPPRGMFFFVIPRGAPLVYRRWPNPIPRCSAFWRRAPTERLVSFDILTTGVRAFEWSLSSLRSAFVHSRRFTVFLADLAFFKLFAPIDDEFGRTTKVRSRKHPGLARSCYRGQLRRARPFMPSRYE